MKPIALRMNATIARTYDFNTLPKPFARHFYDYIKEHKDAKKKSESTLLNECNFFFQHIAPFFASLGFESFAQIDAEAKQRFIVYLNTTLGKKTNRPLGQSAKRHIFGCAKIYFTWLTKHHKDEAPKLAHFNPNPYSKGANAKLKTKIIDETAMEQIKKALRNERNLYVKAFIAVAAYLGLRREDIMELQADCLSDDPDKPGAYHFRYYNHKDSQWYKKPVPKNCSSAVVALKLLIEHTEKLRVESEEKRIFIWQGDGRGNNKKNGSILRFTHSTVTDWHKSYVKRHNITDARGLSPHITPHMFRHSLLTGMDEAGVDVEHAQFVADHKSAETTRRYYIHSRDATYNAQMDAVEELSTSIGVAKDTSCIEDKAFHSNKNALTLPDGYCRDTKMATNDAYICDHFNKRGNCYGCSKLLTTPEFLDYFYQQLEAKEKELDDKTLYGENVLRQIHFQIEMIKKLIEKLESLQGDAA